MGSPSTSWYCTYLKLIVDYQLRDQLGLEEVVSRTADSREGLLTKPNMYTKEVRVEIMKLYHPRWVSYNNE